MSAMSLRPFRVHLTDRHSSRRHVAGEAPDPEVPVRTATAPTDNIRPPNPTAERLHYVDALRLLAIGAVVVVHVAEVFNPWDEWHIANAERSRWAGEIAVLAAPWVMPMVMLLAGVSAWYSLARRSDGAYVRDRALRLLVPLVIGTLVLVPPQVYLERRLKGQFTGSFVDFYPHFFEGIYPRGNLSWHHLWFLAHLFVYAMIALPLFRHWQRANGGATMRWAARVCGAPGGILWLAIPLILERNALWGLFPERHMLTTDWSNHALLFAGYVYGFILAGSPWLGRSIDTQWRSMFVVGLLGTLAISTGTWFGILPSRLPPPYTATYLLFWTLYAICAWAWMVALLGMARRWLNADSAIVRYGRRVGYGMYIVHQPIIVGVAYVVVQTSLGIGAKFSITLLLSTALTMLVADLLSRLRMTRRALGLPEPRSFTAARA
jgi:glucan biosynthesis protein C